MKFADKAVIAGSVYQRLRRGDSIDTRELSIAVQTLEDHLLVVNALGPSFNLYSKELNMSLIQLRQYQSARAEERERR